MDKQRQTAGETANGRDARLASANTSNGAYPKRVRLFSPDGHANNDIITTADDIHVERFLRAHARRIGWRISVRMIREGGER